MNSETSQALENFDFSKIVTVRQALRRLETAETSIGRAATKRSYGDGPESLMFRVAEMLHICSFIDNRANEVANKFHDMLMKYIRADAASLGEAFEIERPKNWNQHAEQFWMKEIGKVEEMVLDLRDKVVDGKRLGMEGAFRTVGKKYNKSWGKIRNDFYKYTKINRAYCAGQRAGLKARYYHSKQYAIQEQKIPYEEWLKIDDDAAKLYRNIRKY